MLRLRLFPAATLVGVWGLCACTVLPGMRSEIDHANTSAGPASTEVNLVPITIDTILQPAGRTQAVDADLPSVNDVLTSFDYKVGVGDILSVIVFDHPELTLPAGEFRDPVSSGQLVSVEGTIYYANIGEIQVAGKSLSEIRRILADRLTKFIVRPQVDVRVSAFRSQRIYVTGEVVTPGSVFLNDSPKGLLDAVNGAGGLTALGSRNSVRLVRSGKSYDLDLTAISSNSRGAKNVLMLPGDIVQVLDTSQEKVFLLGDLTQQKTLPITRGRMTLAEAISSGGGIGVNTGNPKGVFVFRSDVPASAEDKGKWRPTVFAMDLTTTESMFLAGQFPLKSSDIVYVSSTDFSKYNRVIEQILPTVTTLFQLDRLVVDLGNN